LRSIARTVGTTGIASTFFSGGGRSPTTPRRRRVVDGFRNGSRRRRVAEVNRDKRRCLEFHHVLVALIGRDIHLDDGRHFLDRLLDSVRCAFRHRRHRNLHLWLHHNRLVRVVVHKPVGQILERLEIVELAVRPRLAERHEAFRDELEQARLDVEARPGRDLLQPGLRGDGLPEEEILRLFGIRKGILEDVREKERDLRPR
jgi:hypothetical protein